MNHDEKIFVHHSPRIPIPEQLRLYGLWCLHCYTRLPEYKSSDLNHFEHCKKRYFQHYSISHMYEGHGYLWIESGLECEIHPGDVILMPPNIINRYGGYQGKPFIEDTITFSGPVADMLCNAGIIKPCVYHIGLIRRLLPIQEYLKNPSIDLQLKGNMELQRFLLDLYLAEKSRKKTYPLVDTLIQCLKTYPERWWTMQDLADLCKLSKDQMRRVFFEQTGLTPKLYIDRFKLSQAGEELRSTNKSITEIAHRYGYLDQYHFSRRFKSLMGVSPGKYRNNLSD